MNCNCSVSFNCFHIVGYKSKKNRSYFLLHPISATVMCHSIVTHSGLSWEWNWISTLTPGFSLWDLSTKKLHWDGLYPKYFGFWLSLYSTSFDIHISFMCSRSFFKWNTRLNRKGRKISQIKKETKFALLFAKFQCCQSCLLHRLKFPVQYFILFPYLCLCMHVTYCLWIKYDIFVFVEVCMCRCKSKCYPAWTVPDLSYNFTLL